MKNRYFLLSFVTILTAVVTLISSCRKINDATELGGGLIPPVDNINTFDTTVDVEAFTDTFTFATDSQYLAKSEVFYLGRINNDPFFGKTDAQMFLELTPLAYNVYPFARKDSVKIDSVVLVLSYLETYGDSTVPQTVNVYELDQTNNFSDDSAYLIRKDNFTYNTASPLSFPMNQQFVPKNLDDSVKAFQDTTDRQLRIRLDTNFARRLFNYDTSNAYKNDSIFNARFKGFAIRSESSGNAVVGINLQDINTKLAIYYKVPKKNTTTIDSSLVNYFFFTTGSAAANYVRRDYSGSALEMAVGGALPDPVVYIQNSPGSFATLKIPALSTIGNRVIHRAELIMEQIYDPSDTLFRAPEFLYLDANDPSITSTRKFRMLPYDIIHDAFGTPGNLNTFGIIPVATKDASGNSIKMWKFNISRYVQHVLNQTIPNWDLRIYAPFTVSNKFIFPRPDAGDFSTNFNINPTIVKGRVRLGGYNHPTQKMRLRLIYSKL